MRDRDERIREQAKLLAIYDEVRAELMKIPGVVEVGVGIKETGDRLTDQLAFRVYVNEKQSEAALPADQIIPKTIRGYPTDVIKRRDTVPIIGFSDEDDWTNYGTKVGGIRVGNDRDGGTGTLGCFCRRTSDGAIVFISNHHVLYDSGATAGAHVGQPDYIKSCCCLCNDIGEILDGDATLDCAMAKLKDGVAYYTKIRKIRRADGTTELSGTISGSTAAASGEEVWKVGARTGLTRGRISAVAPNIEVTPNAPFTRVANRGDSGSVVVSFLTNNVVGLLKSIDTATETLGYATNIGPVLARLGITVLATDETRDYDVAETDEDRLFVLAQPLGDAFAAFAARLRATLRGRELANAFERHRHECLHLVNHCRPFTVTWHRSAGPTYLAAFARSIKEPAYRIPEELDGVRLSDTLLRLKAALEAHGSDALVADVRDRGEALVRDVLAHDRVEDMISAWEAATAATIAKTA